MNENALLWYFGLFSYKPICRCCLRLSSDTEEETLNVKEYCVVNNIVDLHNIHIQYINMLL